MRRLCTLLALALLAPRVAWACKVGGPGAAAFYESLERPAYLQWSISAAAAILWLSLGRRHPRFGAWLLTLVGLVAIQPAWWMDATRGDCGSTRGMYAYLVALVSIAVCFAGMLRLTRPLNPDIDATGA
jgi:hypothetical protein